MHAPPIRPSHGICTRSLARALLPLAGDRRDTEAEIAHLVRHRSERQDLVATVPDYAVDAA